MKEIPLWPFGKGLGVYSKGVLKQPLTHVAFESTVSFYLSTAMLDGRRRDT